MATELQQVAAQNRYLFLRDGEQVGLTDSPHPHGNQSGAPGQGLGEDMVREVLDLIRTGSELRVAAACPFVRDFFDRNPDYRDLETRG